MADTKTTQTITMDKELLTEVMAQAMMKAQSGRLALPSRAAGEQSNIANSTEYYGLPLPTGNEVIAYQDFINDANNIIDGALHTIQNTLDIVSTTANNAKDGVAAADTKIEELVQANVDNKVSELPQFMKDTNDMLENLQDDVTGLSGWVYPFLNASTGVSTADIRISSIGINFIGKLVTFGTPITETMKMFHNRQLKNYYNPKKGNIGYKIQGNYFNLPEINVYYGVESVGINPTNSNTYLYYFGARWTGTDTHLDFISDSSTETQGVLVGALFPMTKTRFTS